MGKKTLAEILEVNNVKRPQLVISEDYSIFNDKLLLETMKKNIIPNIINEKEFKNINLKEYILKEINTNLGNKKITKIEYEYIYNLIRYEIEDYGPLTELLEDSNITKIMVNSPNNIYIEIDNKIVKDESISFLNNDHIYYIINKFLKKVNIDINKANSIINTELPDGSKLNIILPPVSLNGPVLTIKKYKRDIIEIEDLIRKGTLTPYMARFLEACVMAKLNIIICGKINSGKTTLLNVLGNFINEEDRIVTIENNKEIKINNTNVISLLTNENNYYNKDKITVKNLINNCLNMNPNRIIVGDMLSDEVFNLMEANNMGYSGYIASLRANSLTDMLLRIENILLSNNIDADVVKEYIKNNIDIIVNIERLKDGRVKVTSISEIIDSENNEEIRLKEIFAYKEKQGDTNGTFVLYKYTPRTYKMILDKGIKSLEDIFEEQL